MDRCCRTGPGRLPGRRPLVPGARLAAAFVASVAVSGAAASPALGHAALLESTPAPGARVESAPQEIVLRFTEPLDRSLSQAALIDVQSGRRLPARLLGGRRGKLVLRAPPGLRTAAYRVEWHTVSTLDGHALEGSFSFGVRTSATAGEHRIEQSPLARGGWLRIGARALFYSLLIFFAGGLLNAWLLARGRHPAAWLVPERLGAAPPSGAGQRQEIADRLWRRTLDAGWLAVAMGATVAVVEAADAARGLSLAGVSDFLLSNVAGLARVVSVATLVIALLAASRARWLATASCVGCFYAIAISGHANSADPRLAALLTDWGHLVAGSLWVGGIAQVAAAWVIRPVRSGPSLRQELIRSMLPRFAPVALLGFLVVTATGLLNALIELGHPGALWQTAYGRLLAVKVALVGALALVSYLHAIRIRPRLLAFNPHTPHRLERRHWRLLGGEPLLGLAIAVAAAGLVAFPLPPRQLVQADEAKATLPCSPCPLPRPRPDELAVAEGLGSRVAAAWLRRQGRRLSGRVQLYDTSGRPAPGAATVIGASQRSCGVGCRRFAFSDAPSVIEVRARERGRTYGARLPARWRQGGERRARGILVRAQKAMNALGSLREVETVTSGPGTFARTAYRLRAPDRAAFATNGGVQSVIVGRWQWLRNPGLPWRRQRYAAGGPPFSTRSWVRWTPYARAVRLLSIDRRSAELALMDPATPVWLRIRVDLAMLRVTEVRMIAKAHFVTQRFFGFDQPVRIKPPQVSLDVR